LGREDEGDTTEVVIQVDGRVDVVKPELCIELAHQFEFGTDLEDAMTGSLSFSGCMRSQSHAYLPGERETWNTDLEERDARRADLPRDIGHDA
jgi:hypothetical protein